VYKETETEYFKQLDIYRDLDRKFRIAKTQASQVGTLAALNELSDAARLTQRSRAKTLELYYKALFVFLNDTSGAELKRKETQLTHISKLNELTRRYSTTLEDTSDRLDLDGLSVKFQESMNEFMSTAYQSLILVRIARIQAATDELRALTERLKTMEDAEIDQLPEDRKRGYKELDRTLDEVNTMIRKAYQQYDYTVEGGEIRFEGYSQFISSLDDVYVRLRRGESYFLELAQGYY
jgi:hypothetical protein